MGKEAFRDWHGPYYGFDYVDFTTGHGEIPALYGHYAFYLLASKEEYKELIEQFRASIKNALFEHNHEMMGRITDF